MSGLFGGRSRGPTQAEIDAAAARQRPKQGLKVQKQLRCREYNQGAVECAEVD